MRFAPLRVAQRIYALFAPTIPSRSSKHISAIIGRQYGTSRWWTLRWLKNSISLLGTACGLSTEGTYELFREMRKVMLHPACARALGDSDGSATCGGQRGEACRTQGRLPEPLAHPSEHEKSQRQADAGVGHGSAEADYTIKSQLGQWRKLRRLQIATGGQRDIVSYATRTRTARNAQTADDGSAAAATAASSPAATAAGQTATAATASQLRRLTSERTAKRKDTCDADRTTTTIP